MKSHKDLKKTLVALPKVSLPISQVCWQTTYVPWILFFISFVHWY